MRALLPLSLAASLGLAGCTAQTLSAGNAALVQMVVSIAVGDLCKYGSNQYSKLGNPTSLQQVGKSHMDSVCSDPTATAGTIVAGYNSFASAINAPKAVAVDNATVAIAQVP